MRRATSPRARGRGFTLLELLLAAALGAVVAAAAVALLGAIGRADRQQSARSLASYELERTQRAMQTVFQSLHMSQQAANTSPATARAGGTQGEGPARFLLEPDRRILRAIQRSGGVQRLEVVVNRAPLPGIDQLASDWAARTAQEAAALSPARAWRPSAESTTIEIRTPRRVAFELRPEPVSPGSQQTWTLWYRPVGVLREGEDAYAPPEDLSPAEAAQLGAYPLITGLVECRWSVFAGRERRDAFQAWYANDLPAYLELEVRTASGAYANWLFEVGWLSGVELPGAEANTTNNNPVGGGGGGGA